MTKIEDQNPNNTVFTDVSTSENFEQIELHVENEKELQKEISVPMNRRIGNTYAFLYNKEGEPFIVIGPNWPFYICFLL